MEGPDNIAMDPQTNSRFCCLPPELRNQIFALAIERQPEVDFAQADPPTKDMLLCCKKIHHESKRLIYQAIRKYWKNTTFSFVRDSSTHGDPTRFRPAETRKIRHMEHIQIFTAGTRLTLSLDNDNRILQEWLIVTESENTAIICMHARLAAMRLVALNEVVVMQLEAALRKCTLPVQRNKLNAESKQHGSTNPEQYATLSQSKEESTALAEANRLNSSTRDLEMILNSCCP